MPSLNQIYEGLGISINEILKTLPNQTACGLGWLIDPGVARQYPYYAKIFKAFEPKRIFELGTYLGYSLATAAMVLPELEEIYFVDNNSYDAVTNTMAKENVEHARQLAGFKPLEINFNHTMFPMVEYNFDIAHIDGDHNYQPVLDDLNCVFKFHPLPKVIIGHDYSLHKDVENAVSDFCNKNRLVHLVLPEFNHGLWIISPENYKDAQKKLTDADVGKVIVKGPK